MQKAGFDKNRLPNTKQIRSLLKLAKNQDLHASLTNLMDTPSAWDEAMASPAAWMRAQGLRLPKGMQAMMTKDISVSRPIDLERIGMPGPDWFPYEIKFSNCRTYVVPTRDDEGKITGYSLETVCFGFEIVLNPQPGPFG